MTGAVHSIFKINGYKSKACALKAYLLRRTPIAMTFQLIKENWSRLVYARLGSFT